VRIADQRVIDTVLRAPLGHAGGSSNGAEGDAAAARADDGRVYEVAERMVTVGDYVQVGAPLVRLVDANPLKLRVPVPERRLGTVRRGQAVSVRVEAFDRPFEGHVSRVSPAVDTRSRTFTVEVLVRNADLALKPGSFGTAEIEVGRESALTVPESAVVTFAGVHKVVAVRDGKAEERRVELGERRDGYVEVRDGVEADDVIVAEPTGALTNGTPVTIAASGGPAASAAEKAHP
jgi:membrane fusion protein (multidrug efflux system)